MQCRFSHKPANRAAFTLIELLIVVTIMAMMLALLGGGIRKSVNNARKKQRATEVQTLQTAIMTYWHDIGRPPNKEDIDKSQNRGKYSFTYTDENYKVFSPLVHADANPLGKAYLDWKQLRTVVDGSVRPLKDPDSTKNQSISDPYGKFYKVVIDLEAKDATVSYQ